MFPQMPEEVFHSSIGQFIPDVGWPFSSINDPITHTNWYRLIHPFTLSSLTALSWHRGNAVIQESLIHPTSQADVDLVIINKTIDVLAETGRDCKACRDSLKFHEEFIKTTGNISTPITVAATPESYLKIIDGCHRIAALKNLNLLNKLNVPVWFGMNT